VGASQVKRSPAPDSIELRDVAEADIAVFFEHQLDPEASSMAAFTSRNREDHVAHWHKILRDDSVITKTITFGDQTAGNVVSWEQGDDRLVGYWVGKDFWGKGIATRALSLFLTQLKMRPLHAYVAAHNRGSIRVLEKCGFTVAKRTESPDGVDEFTFVLR
jgi:RimJ/RimL family protein N-acetyltransferase